MVVLLLGHALKSQQGAVNAVLSFRACPEVPQGFINAGSPCEVCLEVSKVLENALFLIKTCLQNPNRGLVDTVFPLKAYTDVPKSLASVFFFLRHASKLQTRG